MHERNRQVRVERRKLINGYTEILEDKTRVHRKGTRELLKELADIGYTEREVNSYYRKRDSSGVGDIPDQAADLLNMYFYAMDNINRLAEEAKETKEKLLDLLKWRAEKNIASSEQDKCIRVLNEDTIKDADGNIRTGNIISVFDSALTRMIGAEVDHITEDFMVVQVYYFDVIKDLIYNGFMYKGEKYIYFTSSAGQIRTKKTVFIKESVWNKYEKTIMCGLTLDDINAKGGNNPNKHLAYMALTNSATDAWEEFDIDKSIVIEDFETQVFGEYDFVDDVNYSIKRMAGYIPITHTDGAGMMLPCMGKNRMVRLPWIKGLLGAFDFVKFIQLNGHSPIIKDIYGIEHDVIAEGIQVIFTKSQFKLWKYYDSWDQYKGYFKQYGCTANYANIELDRIRNSKMTYQMLQSLTDITDEEIAAIASASIDKLKNLCSSVENIQRVFGVSVYNVDQTPLQKAISLYPELLNDSYIRTKLRNMKDSLRKSYKSGKIEIYGKYTFLLPDFYAACEYWFGHINDPRGLLEDGEVFCRLFRNSDKLDCLRSPHLYREHPIRRNVACRSYGDRQEETEKWFSTNAIYTSCHDLISKILQFDVDGDMALVVADKNIISVAERNMKGIVPLYYNMRKAAPMRLSQKTIYDGLSEAFTGSNIGQYSNSISKIWNSEVFISGTDKEKQRALDVIKLLCMENNFRIDYAKTLYMPNRPAWAKELIISFTNTNVPHFFIYAKDKTDEQVDVVNGSFVNKLDSVIPNIRISSRYTKGDAKGKKLGRPDIKLMMRDENLILADKHNPLIEKYLELSKKYYYKIDATVSNRFSPDILMRSQLRQNLMLNEAIDETKTILSAFGYEDYEITDILVLYLYSEKDSKYKDMFWTCYGDIILDNLIRHSKISEHKKSFARSKKGSQCVDCGEWFYIDKQLSPSLVCRCPNCYSTHRRKYIAQKVMEHRAKA